MRKQIVFCFILFSSCIKAQQQPGQIVISAGVGYSPEFNGQLIFITQAYPVSINYSIEGYTCTSILPNLGTTIDVGISDVVSFGLAGSYQSEIVTYRFSSTFSDKVSRTNGAFRLLFHLNKSNITVDDYLGIRCGISYWNDAPSPENTIGGSGGLYHNTIIFLTSTNPIVGSFQVLYGIRLYMTNNIALHFEAGIGSPYLFECGLSYRLNKRKNNPNKVLQQGSYGGHPVMQ